MSSDSTGGTKELLVVRERLDVDEGKEKAVAD